jgi:hypothetical protein
MAYAIAEGTTQATIVGYPFHFATCAKATKSDSVTIFDKPGVWPIDVYTFTNGASGSTATAENWEYNVIRAAEPAAGTFTAADTTIEYDTAITSNRNSGNYYVRNTTSGEIMYCITDSGYNTTSGTMTVIRGCLGTTAAVIADNTYLEVMNVIQLNSANTGIEHIIYLAMPSEYKASIY